MQKDAGVSNNSLKRTINSDVSGMPATGRDYHYYLRWMNLLLVRRPPGETFFGGNSCETFYLIRENLDLAGDFSRPAWLSGLFNLCCIVMYMYIYGIMPRLGIPPNSWRSLI